MSAALSPICRPDGLPFVKNLPGRGTGRNWWSISPTGDPFADSDVGEAHGRMLIDHLRRHPVPTLGRMAFVSSVHSMIEHQSWGHIEIGYLSAIGRYLQQSRGGVA